MFTLGSKQFHTLTISPFATDVVINLFGGHMCGQTKVALLYNWKAANVDRMCRHCDNYNLK